MTDAVARAEGWRRTRPLLATAVVAGLLSVAVSTVQLPGQVALAFANGLQVVAAGAAAFFCVLEGGRKSGAARAGLLLIGAGAACWTAGQLAWAWYELQGMDVPSPSAADFGYLAMYPFAVGGILALSTLVGRPGLLRVGLVLDGILSALAVYVLAWPFLLDPAFEAGSGVAAYITVAYPLGDVVLLSLLGGILLRGRSPWRSGRGLVFAAFACILVADVGYATGVFAGDYATGQLANAGWIVGFFLLAAGARAPPPAPIVASERYTKAIGRWLPIAVLGAAALSILLVLQLPEHADRGWRLAMGLLFLGSGARYALAERENAAVRSDFHALFANMAEGFAHCRMVFERGVPIDWVYLHVNTSFASLTGLTDVVGKPVSVVAPGIRTTNPELFAMYARLARGGPSERMETEVPGLGRWFAVSAYAAGPDEFIAVFDDITQRKRAERTLVGAHAALALSEGRMRSLLDNLDEGFVSTDLVSNRTLNSAGVSRIFGHPRAAYDADAMLWSKQIHPGDAERIRASYADLLAGTPTRDETRIIRPDGEVRWLRASMHPIKDADGRVARIDGTLSDITMEKEAAEQRVALEASGQDVKRLKQLNRMRMDFLNTAAHDLKTPLTPLILQMATLRMNGGLDDRQKASLDLMDRNIARFRVLVEDMLDAARLQAGRLKLKVAAVAFGPLVEEAVASFQEPAKQGHVTVKVAPLPDALVDADPAKAMQVLMNIVSNAIKYTPAGGSVGIRVEISGVEAILAIQDTGLGMSPDQIGRLFQPFVRLHEGMAGVASGTGLGLYISKGIVEQHGGRMWAESEGPGHGSTFHLAWPLAATTAATATGSQSAERPT